MITKDTLKMLSKEQLITIIVSDAYWKHKAGTLVINLIDEKTMEILDKQEACDITTREGWEEYNRLEKEYNKWANIGL